MKRREFLSLGVAIPLGFAANKLASTAEAAVATTNDIYEEGFFTPSLFGDSVAYETQIAQYVRVGNVVHITATIRLTDCANSILLVKP